MTCAPRGISRTYSASVGRRARYRRPSEERTQAPSGWPMIASWAIQPRAEGDGSGAVGVERLRLAQEDQVALAALIDEQDLLAVLERAALVHCNGDRETACVRGWPETGAAWLRSF